MIRNVSSGTSFRRKTSLMPNQPLDHGPGRKQGRALGTHALGRQEQGRVKTLPSHKRANGFSESTPLRGADYSSHLLESNQRTPDLP